MAGQGQLGSRGPRADELDATLDSGSHLSPFPWAPSTERAAPASFWPVAVVVLLAAVLARLWTAGCLGILPNLDSFDYLRIARQLAAGNWSPERLGDVRLPGYPIFLAALAKLSRLDAGALLATQKALGTAAALGFAWSAWQLVGRLGALAVGLFAAWHPVLLLFEHQAMSETLFVASLALVLAAATRVRICGRGIWSGAALGAAAGVSLLVRVNGIAWIAALLAATLLYAPPRATAANRRSRFQFAVALGVGLITLLGPWLARQQLRFGRPSLVDYPEARFVYLAQHGLVDPELPRFAPYRGSFDPADGRTTYAILERLRLRRLAGSSRRTREAVAAQRIFRSDFEARELPGWSAWQGGDPRSAEADSGSRPESPWFRSDSTSALVAEQLAAQPAAARRARLRSMAAFAGLSGDSTGAAWGQSDVRDAVGGALDGAGAEAADRLAALRGALARFLPGAEATRAGRGLELWGTAIVDYLEWGRGILALTFLLLLTLLLLSRRRPASPPLLAALAVGWLATLALHAWRFAALERFAVPFDPVLLLAALLATRALALRRAARRGRAA